MSNPIKKILLIRFSSIGDIIVTTPVIRWLAQQGNFEVHYLTHIRNKSILASNPHISKLITIEKSIHEVVGQLRNENYDLVFDLHKNIRSHILRFLLGVRSISYDKLAFEKWLMVSFKVNRLPKSKHLLDRYCDALHSFGIVNDSLGLDFNIIEEELPFEVPNKYHVLVLGAAHATKRIPADKCTAIINSSSLPFVLIGGRDVVDIGLSLKACNDRVINLTGKLSINQSAIVLHNAQTVVTGDTGMMHLAAALQKDIVLMWGSTFPDFGMYPYYGKNKQYYSLRVNELKCQPCSSIGKDTCPKGHFRCMKDQDITQISSILK